jgi:hypothetical protein
MGNLTMASLGKLSGEKEVALEGEVNDVKGLFHEI